MSEADLSLCLYIRSKLFMNETYVVHSLHEANQPVAYVMCTAVKCTKRFFYYSDF